MWIVLKYNKKELNFLKKDFIKVLGETPLIFRPKIKYEKFIKNKLKMLEKDILGDYLICYHKKFQEAGMLGILKNLRGLKYFLIDSKINQKEIINFIDYCKKNQDSEGFLKQSFFDFSNIKKGIFLSGPFTNMIFNVIESHRHYLKVLVGKITTTVTKDSNYLYRPV